MLATMHAADTKKPEPFEDALRDAVKEYRAGKPDKAREALDKASAILDRLRSGKVANTFPDAPEGWTAGEVEKSDMIGGGRTVKKTYLEKASRKEIVLEVIYDSPFCKLAMGLASNDMIAESQGFKIRKIGNDPALLKEAVGGGELNLPVDENTLVKLTGKGGAGEKELLALARDVDRHALKQLK